MATTDFWVAYYEIGLFRDKPVSGTSSSSDAVIFLTGRGKIGEGEVVELHFLNSDKITNKNVWSPAKKSGRIYLRRTLLPVVIDILRNAKRVYCRMSDTDSSECQISTEPEEIGKVYLALTRPKTPGE
jgi:hypothetical protein